MSQAPFPVLARLPSDAPLRSELVKSGDAPGLLRTLDDPWRNDSAARALFLREVDTARRMPVHPLLVPCLASGTSPSPFLVREFGPLGTLEDLIGGGDMTLDHILPVAAAALDALAALHRAGLAHGDPSPRNLLLTPSAGVRLADPGSARLAFALGGSAPAPTDFRADLKKFLAWFRPFIARSGSADADLARQVRRAVSQRDVEAACHALRAVADLFPSVSLPLTDPLPFSPAATDPVPARLELRPVQEPGTAYRVAKYLGGQTSVSVKDLRRELLRNRISFPTTWPEPARRQATELKDLQADVEVLLDQDAVQAVAVPGAEVTSTDRKSFVPGLGLAASWRRLTAALARLFEDRPDEDLGADAVEAAVATALFSAQIALVHTLIPAVAYGVAKFVLHVG